MHETVGTAQKSPPNKETVTSMNVGEMVMSPIDSSEYITNREMHTKAPDNTAVQQARLMNHGETTPAKMADGDDSNIPPSSSSVRCTHNPQTLNLASKIKIQTGSKFKKNVLNQAKQAQQIKLVKTGSAVTTRV